MRASTPRDHGADEHEATALLLIAAARPSFASSLLCRAASSRCATIAVSATVGGKRQGIASPMTRHESEAIGDVGKAHFDRIFDFKNKYTRYTRYTAPYNTPSPALADAITSHHTRWIAIVERPTAGAPLRRATTVPPKFVCVFRDRNRQTRDSVRLMHCVLVVSLPACTSRARP